MTDYTRSVIPDIPRVSIYDSVGGEPMNPQWQRWFQDFQRIFGSAFSDLIASLLAATSADGLIVSVSDLTEWIAGVANKITVSDDGDGTVTVSLPDSIQLDGATALRLLATDADKRTVGTILASWVAGTTNRITITDDGDGTITITIPDAPELVGLTLTGLTASLLARTDGNKALASLAKQAHIADAATQSLTGADTVDQTKLEADLTSCKNAINAILVALETATIVAT